MSPRPTHRVRFERPYLHPLALPGGEGGAAQQQQLTVHQQRFRAEGFASTVWDSSIVLAKYFERHAGRYAGARCLDLSAGCGLPGLVLARLGARVTATDLSPNLPLLEKNAAANGGPLSILDAWTDAPGRCMRLARAGTLRACSSWAVRRRSLSAEGPAACWVRPPPAAGLAVEVREHTWGADVAALAPPFDVISACDCMYVAEAIEDLVRSLVALSGPATEVLIAHGRNRQVRSPRDRLAWGRWMLAAPASRACCRWVLAAAADLCLVGAADLCLQAEPQFLEAAARHFTIEAVGSAELDELYQVPAARLWALQALLSPVGAGFRCLGRLLPLPLRGCREVEGPAGSGATKGVPSASLLCLQCVDVDVMRLRRKPVGERSGGDAGESKGISSESGQPAGEMPTGGMLVWMECRQVVEGRCDGCRGPARGREGGGRAIAACALFPIVSRLCVARFASRGFTPCLEACSRRA